VLPLSGQGSYAGKGVQQALTLLAGCGSGPHTPDLSALPLVPGSRLQVQDRVFDTGTNAYCAWELVVAAPRMRDSNAMF